MKSFSSTCIVFCYCSNAFLQREDTPPKELESYEASLRGLRSHESAEVIFLFVHVPGYINYGIVDFFSNISCMCP